MTARPSPSGSPGGARSPRRVDGVLFDVDDTLVDTRAAFGHALAGVSREYLPHLQTDRAADVLAVWRADADGHYARYVRGEVDYRTQRMRRANLLHATFGGPALDDETYEVWSEIFERGFTAGWAAHPEAPAVVDDLLAAGVAVGALTNAAVAYQTSKLERAALGDRIEVLVGVDTLGVGKPDPRVFLEACRRLGTDPARTAYVGDELDVDARAAVAAGLVGVWVDRPGPRRVEVPPEDVDAARVAGVHVVPSLDGVPRVLGIVPR